MSFRFASAVSQNPSLFEAIADVATQTKAKLGGRLPDFCQLLITKAHSRNVDHAPKCLLDKLTRLGGINSETLPVVMGGVLQSVSGPGEQVSSGSGVSLLAASLPGVELMPFHVETPALPQLSAEQWSRLLTNVSHRRPRPRSRWSSKHIHVDSSSDSDTESQLSSIRNSTAMLMLSAPHFTEVERLLQRFSNVLPGMPVLGGVTEPNAWGETEHSYGALFLGSRTFAQGAVGCVMHGPLAVQHLMVSGCKAVGRNVMTVTANSPGDPSDILSLDGRPAEEPVVEFISSQPQSQRSLQLQIGINEVGLSGSTGTSSVYDPRLFVARNMRLKYLESGRPVVAVATHEVPIGSRVQLLVPDFDRCQREQREELRSIVTHLGPTANHDPAQFGLLGYSCATLQHDDSQLVEEIWPQVPFAGGRVQGEFAGPASTPTASAHADGPVVSLPAKLHAFSASMGFICHQDILQQQ